MKTKSFRFGTAVILGTLVLAVAGAVVPAQAQTYTVLYNFLGAPGPGSPQAQATAQGRDGNLYSTSWGGTNGGTVFSLTPSGTVTVLANVSGGPYSGVTLGTDGNFYGTNFNGGTGDCVNSPCGQVYKVTPAGVETVLYNFTGLSDGANPFSAPIEGTDGKFYGTVLPNNYCCSDGLSRAYSVTSGGVFTTLHTFTEAEGTYVYGGLVQGTDGNFYGVAWAGGANGWGTIFKMTKAGAVTVLHDFIQGEGQPYHPLIQASDGNFYGVTPGRIFKITSQGTYIVLHVFNFGIDGGNPGSSLVEATDGKLYGVNESFGTGVGGGTIYSITTSGTFTNLHNFDRPTGCFPLSPLRQNTNGTFYGETVAGGNCDENGCGVAYSLDVGLAPFVSLVPTSGRVGDQIGIFGEGFTNASVVEFAGTQATTITLSGTTFITATVPVGAVTGYVTVTTGSTTLTSNNIFRVIPTLQITSAVSRKTHGGAGDFDVALPLTGNPGVECRSGGAQGDHTLVITYSNDVVSGDANVTGGTGNISGTPTFADNTMTVNLTGVTNAQTVTVTLSNVTDSFGQVLPNVVVSAGFLLGDTNANGSVNAGDVAQTKGQSGQTVTAANFREDVNANGSINAGDVALVKSKSGTSLP